MQQTDMQQVSTQQQPCTLRATEQDGIYPRPQLMRDHWTDLCGTWSFLWDDDDAGLDARWYTGWPEGRDCAIRVPFPPESELSGIHETGYHPVAWYRRSFGREQLEQAGWSPENGSGRRVLLHCNAVDYRADVWVNGEHVGTHTGGHTPFVLDITRHCDPAGDNTLTVRVFDDSSDVTQPRGKQDWQENPHVIWYPRTTGIWQPVWLETVPERHIESVHWRTDVIHACVTATVTTSRTYAPPTYGDDGRRLTVTISHDGIVLGAASARVLGSEAVLAIPIEAFKNGQGVEDDYLWTADHPVLLDALVTYGEDHVHSYLGVRSVEVVCSRFLINDRPCYLRSVLEQGYWPQSLLAAPSPAALREEVEIIKSLGFNAARVHQKLADPRFLYWADKLGLMVWGEFPAAYEFNNTAITRLADEWMEAVRRDLSHPCVVAWVPFNESWGVQHIAHDRRQQEYVQGIVALTRAMDDTRPVIGNDGWEQVDSDIVTIHDYDNDPELFAERYGDSARFEGLMQTVGPAGRRLCITAGPDKVAGSVATGPADAPIMLTEFGGITFAPNRQEGEWGYTTSQSAEEYERILEELFASLKRCRLLSGFCYTQLTDTFQEANGLLHADRTPKLPIETIRGIIGG